MSSHDSNNNSGNPLLHFLTWRAWIYTLYGLGVILLVLTIVFWGDWGWDRRLIALTFLVLPLHVLEEWQWPGGFHVQFNVTMKSDRIDRNPMSRLTDSITNFAAMVIGFVLVGIGGMPVAIAMMLFCGLEVVIHTLFGVYMRSVFRKEGKRTIYAPGSITTYLGFLPVGIGFGLYLASQSAGGWDWLGGVGVLAVFLILVILLPERLKDKNSPYSFPSLGYFKKFGGAPLLQNPSGRSHGLASSL